MSATKTLPSPLSQDTFSKQNDALWKITTDHTHLGNFIRPYIGSGLVGTRFGGLVIEPWSQPPLKMYSKFIFDDARQLELPSWLHLDIRVGNVLYEVASGTHRLSNTLDLLRGIVSLEDEWEYRPGHAVSLSIRMTLLRHQPHCGVLSLNIRNLTEECRVSFGLNGAHLTEKFDFQFRREGEGLLIGDYRTRVQKREVTQGLGWKSSSAMLCAEEIRDGAAKLTLGAKDAEFSLELVHSIHGVWHGPNSAQRVHQDVQRMRNTPVDDLFAQSAAAWENLWKRGLAYDSDDAAATKMMVAHQFYLLSSLGSEALPLGALGLSKNEWRGTQLWDADVWMFRAILPLWPELAEPIVRYRLLGLDHARRHSQSNGYRGAWFPWMTSEEGEDRTNPHYHKEIHTGIWIALSAWEYYEHTRDEKFLREVAWPLISEIARFYASFAKKGDDGCYHVCGVIGPDEALTENWQGTCDDHFTIVVGIKKVLGQAAVCAQAMRQTPDADWAEIAEGLYLPPIGADGVIPEYAGYAGQGIKQADLILSFYPLDYRAEPEVVRRNIDYYNGKIMAYGPAMNSQIESCILMRLGDREVGIERLFRTFREFVRGPHFIPFECRDNDNSFMLTGIGGALQTLIYGFYGATVADASALPRIGCQWK